MRYQPRRSGRAFLLSVLIGAFGGLSLVAVLANWGGSLDPSELGPLLVGMLIYGLFALPFVGLGLAIFGLPVSWLVRRRAQDWWVGFLAAVWGGVAGKLFFYTVDRAIGFGNYDIGKLSFHDPGIIFGVLTGLAWWVLYRRELASR